MSKKLLVISLVIAVFGFLFFMNSSSFVSAHNYNYHTFTPTPTHTPTPSPRPKCTHTPTPTTTPTESPTLSPEPTPIETPIATSTPQPVETGASVSTGTSNSGSPVCNDSQPNTPYLLSAKPTGANAVNVSWEKVLGNADGYSIEYGPTSKNYIYSALNLGNVDNYTINGLSGGCFAVRAWNGCADSALSNEVCTGGMGGSSQVLGASTMAGTGVLEDNIYYALFTLGALLISAGIMRNAQAKAKN
jgi:hypothetical protein